MEILSFLCSDNADDEIWHEEHARKLLEPYNNWFEKHKFKYTKDYIYKFQYDTLLADDRLYYRVFLETSNNKLLTLFKLRWK
jgi:hypothetical protein|tara:strand:+ start:810 stop:1055 length:246 start_codon:yes stop_codon:yes gene_type:complete